MSRVRIVHVINSFEFGGAEAMLCNLLLRTDMRRFEPSVVSLIDDLTVAKPVLDAGIPIKVIGMRPGIPDPRGVFRLARHLRRTGPAVVQTWMDHSNLIGGLAARVATRARVVWGVHHSHHVPGVAKRSTLATVAACAMASKRVPHRIVYCSQHSANMYGQRGFAADKATIIPNGFDTALLRPDPEARAALRREIGVGADVPLIGLAARFDPCKDHSTFLKAAAHLAARRSDVRFLLCGADVNHENAVLADEIGRLGIADRCHLLGPRRDMPRIFAALDLATSSSITEAFPLVLGEAMSCGVPCVATDVGDSALIVGDAGRIVPPAHPTALAGGWAELLALDAERRAALGRAARRRVVEMFDLGAVTRRYEAVYDELLETTPQLSPSLDVHDEPASRARAAAAPAAAAAAVT